MNQVPPCVEMSGFSLTRGGKPLLDGVDLQIRRGERVAIVGPNGAGKTTLLRCLLGMIHWEHGEVRIDGQPLGSLSRQSIARNIAYVPQSLSEHIPFSVRDFLLMSRYSRAGMGGDIMPGDREGDDVAQAVMQRVGIPHLANRTINTLSGGERQKVSLAAALTQQTPVLFLDEPAAHLDPRQRESIEEILGELQDKTLVAVTHDLNWAAMEFGRIIGMRTGKIIIDSPPEEFMTTGNLRDIFDTAWKLYPHPENGMPMVVRSSHAPTTR